MNEIQQGLYNWIERAAEAAPGREPLAQLVLSHVNASDQLQEIARFVSLSDLGAVKSEVFKTAGQVVSSWRHFQRFALQAYYGSAQQASSYYPFSLGYEPGASTPEATEPANSQGQLRQQMRHNEVLAKINAQKDAASAEILLRMNKQLMDQLEGARSAYAQLWQQTQGQLVEQQRREVELTLSANTERRKDELATSVTKTLPYIANRISEHLGGPKLLPENGTSPFEAMLSSLFSGLTDDSFARLLAVFPEPAQQAAILEMYAKLVPRPSASTAVKQ